MDATHYLALATGALFGWFIHRRLDDLNEVKAKLEELAKTQCKLEVEVARLKGRINHSIEDVPND